MALDRSPFDTSRGPRPPRRPGTGLLGLLAAVAAALALALGVWSLGSVDRVVPPVDPRETVGPSGEGAADPSS